MTELEILVEMPVLGHRVIFGQFWDQDVEILIFQEENCLAIFFKTIFLLLIYFMYHTALERRRCLGAKKMMMMMMKTLTGFANERILYRLLRETADGILRTTRMDNYIYLFLSIFSWL